MNQDSSDTEEMQVLRFRVETGMTAVAGTSAGTAVEGGVHATTVIPMVTGGESYESWVYSPMNSSCNDSECDNYL